MSGGALIVRRQIIIPKSVVVDALPPTQRDNDLHLTKCVLNAKRRIISQECVKADLEKVADTRKMPTPTDVEQVPDSSVSPVISQSSCQTLRLTAKFTTETVGTHRGSLHHIQFWHIQ